jgi:hypothetical protein
MSSAAAQPSPPYGSDRAQRNLQPILRNCRLWEAVAYLLQLRVGRLVAMLDRIGAGIIRCLYAGRANRMHSDLQMRAMCLCDRCRELRYGEVLVGRDLDHVHVLKLIPPYCLTRAVRSVTEQEYLIEDRVGKSGAETLEVVASRDELAPRREQAWVGNAARGDCVAQFGIASHA